MLILAVVTALIAAVFYVAMLCREYVAALSGESRDPDGDAGAHSAHAGDRSDEGRDRGEPADAGEGGSAPGDAAGGAARAGGG